MHNKKFWNAETNGFLQQKVLAFIDNEPALTAQSKAAKRKLVKSLLGFIESVKEPIYREVEREYQREDVSNKIEEWFGKKGEAILAVLPLSEITYLVEHWQDILIKNDNYWESYWMSLEYATEDMPWGKSLADYTWAEIRLYKAYLKEWFKNNATEDPMTISEFINKYTED